MPNFQAQVNSTLNTILGSVIAKQFKRTTDIEVAKTAAKAVEAAVDPTNAPYVNENVDPALQKEFLEDTEKLKTRQGRKELGKWLGDENYKDPYEALARQHAWQAQDYANDAAIRVAETAKTQLEQMYKLKKGFLDQ